MSEKLVLSSEQFNWELKAICDPTPYDYWHSWDAGGWVIQIGLNREARRMWLDSELQVRALCSSQEEALLWAKDVIRYLTT